MDEPKEDQSNIIHFSRAGHKPIHINYARMTPFGRSIIDNAFNEIGKYLFLREKVHFARDDRAERFVEAIATFVIDSNPEMYNDLVTKEPI